MHAYVYKSQLKPDTYVYVPRRDDFSALPAPLLTSLGALTFVLDVTLDAQRRLAQADPDKVRSDMSERGFYPAFALCWQISVHSRSRLGWLLSP